MIKLKLTKNQLQILCSWTKPAFFEFEGIEFVCVSEFHIAAHSFNLMAIGERATKLYLFGHKEKYSISLTTSEGCSLLEHIKIYAAHPGTYDGHIAELIKTDLHYQLINYQKRFYGEYKTKELAGAGN
jgi:hypothetical protein